jgi:hypothetical protein
VDISDLISSFATNAAAAQYQVTRRAKSTMVRGRSVAGATTAVQITASVQPATGRDLLQLEEGRRSVETRVVFTSAQLMIGAQGAPFESDLVAIDGRSWEVLKVESWEASPIGDGAFYRCIVQATT